MADGEVVDGLLVAAGVSGGGGRFSGVLPEGRVVSVAAQSEVFVHRDFHLYQNLPILMVLNTLGDVQVSQSRSQCRVELVKLI